MLLAILILLAVVILLGGVLVHPLIWLALLALILFAVADRRAL